MEAVTVQHMALPLHIQRLENVLNLRPYLNQIEQDFNQSTHFVNMYVELMTTTVFYVCPLYVLAEMIAKDNAQA